MKERKYNKLYFLLYFSKEITNCKHGKTEYSRYTVTISMLPQLLPVYNNFV